MAPSAFDNAIDFVVQGFDLFTDFSKYLSVQFLTTFKPIK
jgi:hypothetical protein